MSAFSDYMEDKVINWSLRNTTAGTAPTNVYISLHTTTTTDAGGGTEVSTFAYARKAVSTTGGFNAPSGGSTANTAEIAFAAASGGNWGTITHFGVWDALTGVNMLYHGPLTASKTVNDGDVFRFAAGALVITIA